MPRKEKKAKKSDDTEFVSTEDHDNESPEEHQINITLGKEDEDVYTKEGREDLQENDEIEVWEESFSEGTGDDGGTE